MAHAWAGESVNVSDRNTTKVVQSDTGSQTKASSIQKDLKPNWFLATLNGELCSAFGTVASLLGLCLSVWVLWTIKRIEKFYSFKVRVPLINNELSEIASKISDQLNDFEGYTTKTKELLARAEVALGSLKKKVDKELKNQIKTLLKDIKRATEIQPKYNNIEKEKELLNQVYIKLYRIHKECSIRIIDAEWERQ